jgi:hypothetical protein
MGNLSPNSFAQATWVPFALCYGWLSSKKIPTFRGGQTTAVNNDFLSPGMNLPIIGLYRASDIVLWVDTDGLMQTEELVYKASIKTFVFFLYKTIRGLLGEWRKGFQGQSKTGFLMVKQAGYQDFLIDTDEFKSNKQ